MLGAGIKTEIGKEKLEGETRKKIYNKIKQRL